MGMRRVGHNSVTNTHLTLLSHLRQREPSSLSIVAFSIQKGLGPRMVFKAPFELNILSQKDRPIGFAYCTEHINRLEVLSASQSSNHIRILDFPTALQVHSRKSNHTVHTKVTLSHI